MMRKILKKVIVFPRGIIVGLVCSFLFSLALPNLLFKEGLHFFGLEILLSFICLCILFKSLSSSSSLSQKVQLLLAFATGYSLMLLYWIYIPMEPFKGISPPLALVLSVVFFVFHFVPYVVVMPFFWGSRFKSTPLRHVLLFAFSLACAESLYPQITPVLPAHALVNVSVTKTLAQLGGLPLVSFVFYFFVLTTVSSVFSWIEKAKILILGVFFIHAPTWFLGKDPLVIEKKIKINLVQPNSANKIKKDVEAMGIKKFASTLQQELFQTTSKERTDLIIWPETAIPFNLSEENLTASPAQVPILKKGVLASSHLLTGIYFGVKNKPDRATNSAVLLIDGELVFRYDKMMLKPFAETFPIESLNDFFGKVLATPYNVERGTTNPMFRIQGFGFLPFICYESLKSGYWRDYLNSFEERPYFAVSLANDKWFGESSQPHLHYLMNQWRSLEFNIPVVRSANSGVSGIILPESLNFHRTPSGVQGSPVLELSISKRQKTLYQQYGLLPLIVSFLFLFFLDWAFRATLKKHRKVSS